MWSGSPPRDGPGSEIRSSAAQRGPIIATMTGQDPTFTLLEAARIVARGSELDAKLDALCVHVLSAAGASAAVVYLFDPVARVLVPAAQAGLSLETLGERASIAADDPDELVAHVVRERRAASATSASSGALADQADEGATQVALPLVAADEAGGEDAEGVLLASFV